MEPGAEVAGRFVIERLAGQGGMAAVYSARDLQTGSRVALKLLTQSGVDSEVERFTRECEILRTLRGRFARIGLSDRGAVFNTELLTALELDSMLAVAEAVAHSAILREESRGSHTRTDFPKRDDTKFLRHSLAYRTADGPRIDYLPVTITRWAPEERKY